MRRLFRVLSSSAAAVSLVLCVATAVVWARSYLPEDVRAGAVDGRIVVLFTRGEWTVEADARYFAKTPEFRRAGKYVGLRGLLDDLYAGGGLFPWAYTRVSSARGLGFVCVAETGARDPRWQYCGFAVHLGWLLAVVAVLPAWRAASALRANRRAARNLCPFCGYALTGNVSGVCPECGTPVKPVGKGEA